MKTKEELIRIYNETVKFIKDGEYSTFGMCVEFKDSKLRTGSYIFDQVKPLGINSNKIDTKIYVQNIDSFTKAIELGPDCLVLNMASRRNPGGGVSNGSRAQEEDLCRRSNLLLSLYSFSGLSGIFEFKKRNGSYPLPACGGVYTPEVTIFRRFGDYKLLEEPFYCSVISLPGINRPKLDSKGNMIKSLENLLKDKLRNLFRVSYIEGHKKLVLGALGCGAFGCPAKHVATIFNSILHEPEFDGRFSEICFAILEDSNSLRKDNPEGNLKPFAEVFGYGD